MDILVTVDVEASSYTGKPLPYSKMVDGEIDGEYFGVSAIMDICEKFGAKGTFFVDVFEYANVGRQRLKDTCRDIKRRGHSVELHTHPSRIWDRMCMKDYSLQEQIEIIRKGKDLLHEWTGEPPVAHRAGSFGANADTMAALKESGFRVDSSSFFSYKHCRLNLPTINQVSEYGGILQVPPTLFTALRLGPFMIIRNLDIDTCTFSELKHVIDKGRKKGLKAATILLHSFSFIRRNADSTEFSPDRADRDRFVRVMKYLADSPGVRFVTMKQLYENYTQKPEQYAGKDFMPHSGFLRTFIRACKRWRTSRKNLFFLIVVLCVLTIVFLLSYHLIIGMMTENLAFNYSAWN